MPRFGQIRESSETAAEFRKSLFFSDTLYEQLGNGGVPKDLQEFLKQNKSLVEDVFSDSDTVYILPKTKEFAGALFKRCTGEPDKDGDYINNCADEIDWHKIEGRYWLGLWWD